MTHSGAFAISSSELKKVCWAQCASSCAYMRRWNESLSARPFLVTKMLHVVEFRGGKVSKGTYAAG
jgi:hypothetical protein